MEAHLVIKVGFFYVDSQQMKRICSLPIYAQYFDGRAKESPINWATTVPG